MRNVIISRDKLTIFMRVSGFLDAAAVDEIAAEMRQAALTLGDAIGQHDFLFDLSGTNVAAQSAIDTLCRLLCDPQWQSRRARRIAFFTPSALLRLQLQRVCAARTGIAAFEDRKSAHDWLMQDRKVAA